MKTLRLSVHVLSATAAIGLLHVAAFAQHKTPLPPPLNENSSLIEVVSWLDRNVLANARVELRDSWESGSYRPPWDHSEAAKATWILGEGFRLKSVDGCTLLLRNDHVKTFSKSMKLEGRPEHFAAELYVPLHRLGPTKGRSPYRFTNDPEKIRVLGGWRTKFKYKGLFSRPIVELRFFSDGPGYAKWESEDLAFTFDNKDVSEKFDGAFRQAISLCQRK